MKTIIGAVLGVVACAAAMSACRYTGFADAPAKSTAATATDWLVDQQQPDGGFELAGFAGFETPTRSSRSPRTRSSRPGGTRRRPQRGPAPSTNGNNALHDIDDFVDGTSDQRGQAAKVIVLVAEAARTSRDQLQPRRRHRQEPGRGRSTRGAQPNGSYGTFNATAYAAIAKKLVDGSVPANTVAFIRAAQEASGGWDFNGEPTGNEADVDTTSIAIQALAAAGVPGTDPDLRAGLGVSRRHQRADGAWRVVRQPRPELDVDRDLRHHRRRASIRRRRAGATSSRPDARGQPYTSPMVWLRSQQNTGARRRPIGRINSPNDSFGVSTFATTQSIQAFRYGWNPVSPLPPQQCP